MIRISCKNERFTYDMYHIVKSFLPDAEISQKVDPEQELLIEMTAEEEPDLEEQACDKKVRWSVIVLYLKEMILICFFPVKFNLMSLVFIRVENMESESNPNC